MYFSNPRSHCHLPQKAVESKVDKILIGKDLKGMKE
jgi:hypothetical protein